MFIIRNIQTGQIVGSPFPGGRFQWHGLNSFCETAAYHGAQLKNDVGAVLQQVYEIVEQTAGSGPAKSIGSPVYNSGSDTVTRTTTYSDPALTGAAKTAAVNAEADRRLLLAYPLSEQIWGVCRGVELLKKKAIDGGNLTVGETNTLNAILVATSFVNAIRTSRLALINNGDKTMAQITDNAAWPAQP